MPSSYVYLDVGGTPYTTSKTTLTKYPNSMLAIMCSKEWESSTGIGSTRENPITIDRSGKLFEHIIEFLRNGAEYFVFPNTDIPFLMQLYVEACFYGIGGLQELIKKRYLQPQKIAVSGLKFIPEVGNTNLFLLRRDSASLTRLAKFCSEYYWREGGDGDVFMFMNDDQCSCDDRGRSVQLKDYDVCSGTGKFHFFGNLNIRANVIKVYGSGPTAHVDVKFHLKLKHSDDPYTEVCIPNRPVHMALSDFKFGPIDSGVMFC